MSLSGHLITMVYIDVTSIDVQQRLFMT